MIVAVAGAHVNRGHIAQCEGCIAAVFLHHDLIAGNDQANVVIAIGAGDVQNSILKIGAEKRSRFQSLEHSSLSRRPTVLQTASLCRLCGQRSLKDETYGTRAWPRNWHLF